MIHIAHIFMGKQLKQAASSFSDYIHRIGVDNIVSKYFVSYLWAQNDDGWIASKLVSKNQKENANSIENIEFDYIDNDVSNDASVKALFNDLFSDFLTIETVQHFPELKLLLYVPLYDDKVVDETMRIIHQLEVLDRKFSIDIVGISSDFAALFEENYDNTTFEENQSRGIDFASKIVECNSELKNRFVILQNRRSDGVSQRFTYNSFITTIAEYALALTECYNEVFPSQIQPGDVTGVGMSILSLDKMYFVTYLMRRAFVKVLDAEKITQEKCDVTQIQPVVNACLCDEIDIFKKIYDTEVEPLVNQNKSHDEIVTIISPKVRKHFEDLKVKLQSFMNDSTLSLPDKQACLAMLLGQDDDIFDGYLFNKNSYEIDDCYATPIDLYIGENNKTLEKQYDNKGHLKSVKGIITKSLNINADVYFPLYEMKRLKREMSQMTQGLRMYEDELENLKKIAEIEHESEKKLTKNGFVYSDFKIKLNKEAEVQLQVDYDSNSELEASVDLRNLFTTIKSQGEIGSCTVFALSAIYEYILKRSTQKEYDLSERFVFYNTNIKENKAEKGTSYQDVLKSMETNGICEEIYCPYVEDEISVVPDEKAFENAMTHLVTEAKNVRINHKDIRLALTDGYPVAISLKVYDSFEDCDHGFISYPTEAEIISENYGNHAMVICGYSDEDRLYVVRNSWGEDFGDKGYCYIPYSYIENPKLNNFSCVITRTQEGEVKAEHSKTSVHFDKTDNNIKQNILQNIIFEERKRLEKRKEKYNKLQYDYQQLLLILQNQEIRDQITESAIAHLNRIINKKEDEYKIKLSDIEPDLEKQFKKEMWKTLAISAGVTLISLIFCFLSWYYNWSMNLKIFNTLCSAGCITFMILYYHYKKNELIKYKQELENERASLLHEIDSLKRERSLKSLKLFLSGMIIDKVVGLKHDLENKYTIAKNYITNLRIWRDEESDILVEMKCDTQMPFMNVLSNKQLDDYFDANYENILRGIRFSEFLEGYDLDNATMIQYKQMLRQTVIDRLFEVIADFNMYMYLSGYEKYPYLDGKSETLENLLKLMDVRSDIFLQNTILTPTNEISSKIIFANVPVANRNDWMNTYRAQFRTHPIGIDIESPYKLVVFSTKELGKNEVTILRKN